MASVRKRTWTTNGREKSAWICDYVDGSGKRRLKTFATKKAADAWSVQALHQVASGTHSVDRESITVKEAGEVWIRRGEVERLEASTLRHYRLHLNHHIAPALGAVRLSKLSTPCVATFADAMLRSNSRVMTRKVLATLRAILNTAQRQGLVAQNVALAVKVGAQDRHTGKVEIPAPEEVRKLLAAAPTRWRPFLLTATLTGLRASELRGLRWADLDLDGARLTVSQRADENGRIGSPKSAASRRSIPLPPAVVAALTAWHGDKPAREGGLVFPNAAGKPAHLSNLYKQFWWPLQIACGLVELRPDRNGQPVARARYGMHVLRHFYASLLIDRGFPPKRVQSLMGHSSVSLTLDTYGHLFPDDAADAARLQAVEAALLSPAVAVGATRMRQVPVST
jgi:integrase